MKVLCREHEGDPRYFRFQTKLTGVTDDMDNATPANIAALKHELIADQPVDLDKVCRALTAPAGAPA
jgi:hypothetical protein